jgi:hypothetical protein
VESNILIALQQRLKFRICLLATCLLCATPCGFALGTNVRISQYGHTAWRMQDGMLKGGVLKSFRQQTGISG